MEKKLIYSLILIPFISLGIYLIWINSNKSQFKDKEPGLSGAWAALDFWTRSRAYPEKDIPSEKYYREYKRSRARLSFELKNYDKNSEWETMGPMNVSGRMISLAVNPQNPSTLYAGSASGGLWRTYSAETGGGWHRISTGYPVLGVMAIAIDPSDTNTIFIGTGEVYGYKSSIGGVVIHTTRGSYGIGILKTTDGGQTWIKSLDWTTNQERGVQCIRMNPLNSNTLYAATSEGIFKTTNGGDRWVNVLPVLMGEDIIIHATDTSKVLVSCGNFGSEGTGLYRSLNAGMDWTEIDQLPSYDGKTLLEMYASNPDIVFASVANARSFGEEDHGLWRTDDFGINWTNVNRQNIALWQGYYSHWVAVHPTDLNQIMQGGVFLNKSNDGGASFDVVTTNFRVGPYGGSDYHAYAHHPTDPNVIYVAFDQGIARISDFDSDFKVISQGLQTTQFYNGFSNSGQDSNFALGGLQDNLSLIYSGSVNWRYVGDGDGGWNAVNPLDDRISYVSFVRGHILKSIDHGETYYAAYNGLEGSAAFVAPFVICPSYPNILYAGRKKVFKSTDDAARWSAVNDVDIDGNVVLSMAVSRTNPDVVYVGTAPIETRAHLYRTLDGGDTWVDVTNTLPDRYPMDVAVDHEDDRTVYAVFAGFGSGHVYKSIDAADNWVDITGTLPDIPTLSVVVDPLQPSHIYIGNDIGVYVSQDGGATWNAFMGGLPEAVIAMDLSISSSNRKLRVATHGNGVYQRALIYKPETYLKFSMNPVPEVNLQGTAFNFSGSVTNMGTEVFADSFAVKVRITGEDSGIEYFNRTTEVNNLNPGIEQSFSFDGTFTARDTGNYFIDFIKLGTGQNTYHDTLRQVIRVITLPGIARASVVKESTAYSEIQGEALNLSGDEGTEILTLPFVFNYDGYEYDQIQISVNGWAELGYGDVDSERGITSSERLYYSSKENNNLAAEARPTKMLAPWWDDLDTGDEGIISHEIIGSEPNRVFIVQWKNVRADSTYETSALINFQLHLFETSNIIEFHYGAVQNGSFANEKAGASIGFKDHLGGDYHFYDIIKGGTGRSSDLVTDLSPLTDWPGPDVRYTIQANPGNESAWTAQSSGTTNALFGVSAVSDQKAWVVGVYGTVLHTTDGGTTWDNAWTQTDTVHFYDVECVDDNTVLILGYSISPQSVLTSHLYKTTDGGASWAQVFNEDGVWLNDIEMFGLSEGVATGDPIDSVWVILKTADAGDTWSQIESAPSAVVGEVSTPNAVCWVNRSIGWYGSNMSKAYRTIDGAMSWSTVNIPKYYDYIRLAFNETGLGLASSGSSFQRTNDNGISWEEIQSPDSSLIYRIISYHNDFRLLFEHTIYKSVDSGLSWELETSTDEAIKNLSFITIEDKIWGWGVGRKGIILKYEEETISDIEEDIKLPEHFVLSQNYPNPFNYSTTIRYELPKSAKVVLMIYNLRGQRIKTLVDKVQVSGKKMVVWNGSNDFGNLVASGIYFYRIQADNKFKTKKMLFLK